MASNEKLLPCPFCGDEMVKSESGLLTKHKSFETSKCILNTFFPNVDHLGVIEKWNTRAAQPVAVEQMPEFEVYRWDSRGMIADAEYRHYPKKGFIRLNAFTAWLSKAAQGLPEPVAMPEWDEEDGFGAMRNWYAADAVQPLVAQLRAERDNERKFRLSAEGGWREANKVIAMQRAKLDEFEDERDALRAEVDKANDYKDAAIRASTHMAKERDALRTANAELVGLLRDMEEDDRRFSKVYVSDYIQRIKSLLASAGGGQ